MNLTLNTFQMLVWSWILSGLVLFPVLLKFTAPYGRHSSRKWGPVIPNRLAWIIMEIPALLVFAWFFLRGPAEKPAVQWIFFGCWMLHYTNRSLVFPLRIRDGKRRMPLIIMLMAVFFNLVNGFLNGWYLGNSSIYLHTAWLTDIRFMAGIALFAAGMAINWHSDNILIGLRKQRPAGTYLIPRRGLFSFVSCPNFLGEIIEWGGFALMTWSPAALSFFLWTIFNLLPRALDHHRWYKNHFPDYPPERKAVIPFLL